MLTAAKFRDFANALLSHGVHISPANTLHSLSSLSHTDADIAFTAEAIARTLDDPLRPYSPFLDGDCLWRDMSDDRIRSRELSALAVSTITDARPPCALQPLSWPKPQNRGGIVRAVVNPEPSRLMLGLVQNTPTQMVAGNIYESLLNYAPDLKPMPSLAKSWEISPDRQGLHVQAPSRT